MSWLHQQIYFKFVQTFIQFPILILLQSLFLLLQSISILLLIRLLFNRFDNFLFFFLDLLLFVFVFDSSDCHQIIRLRFLIYQLDLYRLLYLHLYLIVDSLFKSIVLFFHLWRILILLYTEPFFPWMIKHWLKILLFWLKMLSILPLDKVIIFLFHLNALFRLDVLLAFLLNSALLHRAKR